MLFAQAAHTGTMDPDDGDSLASRGRIVIRPGHFLSSLFLFTANGSNTFQRARLKNHWSLCLPDTAYPVNYQVLLIASHIGSVLPARLPPPSLGLVSISVGLWPWSAPAVQPLPDPSTTERQSECLRMQIEHAWHPLIKIFAVFPSLRD